MQLGDKRYVGESAMLEWANLYLGWELPEHHTLSMNLYFPITAGN